MGLTFNLWALPALGGVCIAALAGRREWRRPGMPGGRALLWLAVGVGWWCLLQAVSLHLTTVEGKVLAAKLQYLGVSAVPIAWLWFALSYTGRGLGTGFWTLLVPEVATLLLAWSNERHGLIWAGFELLPARGFVGMRIEHGVWFEVHVYYAYALLLLATGVLVVHLAQLPHHRARIVAVVAAPLLPWVANLAYLSSLLPADMIDPTPTGLALGGAVLGWSLLRHDLLAIPAVARSRILDTIRDGVVVLNGAGRIADLNRGAARILGLGVGDPIGPPFADRAGVAAGGVVEHGDSWFEVGASPLGEDAARMGTVLVIRDVTERHQIMRELRRVSDELRAANERLAHLANTDVLVGVANRRHFMERFEHELGRARRVRRPVSLALLDIDHFKAVNDSHGHSAGDRVLEAVTVAMQHCTREIDLVGRIGGDELAVALPDSGATGARAVADRVRETLAADLLLAGGVGVPVTLSIGIAVSPLGDATAEEMLHAADVALYRAKALGRDRVHLEVMPPRSPHALIPLSA